MHSTASPAISCTNTAMPFSFPVSLQAVQDALVQLCAELNEAAAVSEGEVERLVEKEAMALNVAILENRWGGGVGHGSGMYGLEMGITDCVGCNGQLRYGALDLAWTPWYCEAASHKTA